MAAPGLPGRVCCVFGISHSSSWRSSYIICWQRVSSLAICIIRHDYMSGGTVLCGKAKDVHETGKPLSGNTEANYAEAVPFT